MSAGLSFIILAYNEEAKINQTIFNYLKQLKKSKIKFEMIVVNDGSKDNTLKIISKFKKKIKIINNKKNIGFAKSLKRAIKNTNYSNFLWIGADNPDRSFVNIFKEFKLLDLKYKDKFILVQYYDYKNKKRRSFLRRVFSNYYTNLVNFVFFKSIPYYNGQSVYNKNFFNVNKLCNSRFILAQILLVSLNYNPKLFFIRYNISNSDIDETSSNLLYLVTTTIKDLFIYRILTIKDKINLLKQ